MGRTQVGPQGGATQELGDKGCSSEESVVETMYRWELWKINMNR